MPSEPRTSPPCPALKPRLVPIDSLIPDPANLRRHTRRSTAAIVESLRRFGQQKPIVVDAGGVVIAGNGTLEAARQLGWNQISVVRSELSGAERIGYAIADNRTAELSEWDDEGLQATLREFDAGLAAAAGFTGDELAELLAKADGPIEDDGGPPLLPESVTRRGELWILGDHRLLCGDSTDPADIARLMDGRRASLVSTDPPYLVDYTGKRLGDKGKDWSQQYREIDVPDAENFFRSLFRRVVEVLDDHAPIYCWHAHKRVAMIQRVWEELGILDHQQVVWVKPCPLLGSSMYHFQHEPCVIGWRRGSAPKHDGQHDTSSVWVVAWDERTSIATTEESDVWMLDWEGKKRPVNNEHPTQKPVEIFARPMRKHTAAGDVCFEPFSGSGSQLIAAQRLGRRCFAMELEPTFVDVAVRRWQAMTGHAARLDGDGRTWEETRAIRCPESIVEPPPPPAATSKRRKQSPSRRTTPSTETPPVV